LSSPETKPNGTVRLGSRTSYIGFDGGTMLAEARSAAASGTIERRGLAFPQLADLISALVLVGTSDGAHAGVRQRWRHFAGVAGFEMGGVFLFQLANFRPEICALCGPGERGGELLRRRLRAYDGEEIEAAAVGIKVGANLVRGQPLPEFASLKPRHDDFTKASRREALGRRFRKALR
jgi:hypothetical protein